MKLFVFHTCVCVLVGVTVIVGETNLFAEDPVLTTVCRKSNKTFGHHSLLVPHDETPSKCDIIGDPTDGIKCTIGNFQANYPDACEDISRSLQSRAPQPLPHLGQVCQPTLSNINLFTLSCANADSVSEVALNFTFTLPICDKGSTATLNSVKVDFSTSKIYSANYFYKFPICRLFNFTGSDFSFMSDFTKKVEVWYDWMAIGLQDTYPEIYYYLSLTAFPSGAQLHYTIVYKDVDGVSMRLVAGAWQSQRQAHFVFMPINGIHNYRIEAKSDRQAAWTHDQQVSGSSFTVPDIPAASKIVTVTVTPIDNASCRRPNCSPITLTLDKSIAINLLNHLPDESEWSPWSWQQLTAVIVVAVTVAVALVIGTSLLLYRRKKNAGRAEPQEEPEPPKPPVLILTNLPATKSTPVQDLLSHRGYTVRRFEQEESYVSQMKTAFAILIQLHLGMENDSNFSNFVLAVRHLFENRPLQDRIRVVILTDEGGSRLGATSILQKWLPAHFHLNDFLRLLEERTRRLPVDQERMLGELYEAQQSWMDSHAAVATAEEIDETESLIADQSSTTESPDAVGVYFHYTDEGGRVEIPIQADPDSTSSDPWEYQALEERAALLQDRSDQPPPSAHSVEAACHQGVRNPSRHQRPRDRLLRNQAVPEDDDDDNNTAFHSLLPLSDGLASPDYPSSNPAQVQMVTPEAPPSWDHDTIDTDGDSEEENDRQPDLSYSQRPAPEGSEDNSREETCSSNSDETQCKVPVSEDGNVERRRPSDPSSQTYPKRPITPEQPMTSLSGDLPGIGFSSSCDVSSSTNSAYQDVTNTDDSHLEVPSPFPEQGALGDCTRDAEESGLPLNTTDDSPVVPLPNQLPHPREGESAAKDDNHFVPLPRSSPNEQANAGGVEGVPSPFPEPTAPGDSEREAMECSWRSTSPQRGEENSWPSVEVCGPEEFLSRRSNTSVGIGTGSLEHKETEQRSGRGHPALGQGAAPQSFHHLPHQNIGHSPENYGQSPPNYSQLPQNDGQLPDLNGHLPQHNGHLPTNNSHFTPNYSQWPPNYNQFPPNDGHLSPNNGHLPLNNGQFPPNDGLIPQDDVGQPQGAEGGEVGPQTVPGGRVSGSRRLHAHSADRGPLRARGPERGWPEERDRYEGERDGQGQRRFRPEFLQDINPVGGGERDDQGNRGFLPAYPPDMNRVGGGERDGQGQRHFRPEFLQDINPVGGGERDGQGNRGFLPAYPPDMNHGRGGERDGQGNRHEILPDVNRVGARVPVEHADIEEEGNKDSGFDADDSMS